MPDADSAAENPASSNASNALSPGLPALRALVSALNHLLSQHPNACQRLAAHQGALLRMGVDADTSESSSTLPQPQLWLKIAPSGFLEPASSAQADVQLLVKPSVQAGIDFMANGAAGLMGHLRVEGSVLLAGLIGEIIQDLRWDFEDDLARVIGDIPARRVGEAVSTGRQFFRRLIRDVSEHVSEQAAQATSHPESPVVHRSGMQATNDSIASLTARIDALEKKLNPLTQAETDRYAQ